MTTHAFDNIIKKMRKLFLSLIVSCLLLQPAAAQAVLNDDGEIFEIEQFAYLIDSTAKLEINAIQNSKLSDEFISYNAQKQIEINPDIAYWLRFTLENRSSFLRQWVLEFQGWSYVNLYSFDENNQLEEHVTGHLVRYVDRDYPKGDFNFILINIKEDKEKTYYAKLRPVLNGRLQPRGLTFKVHTKTSADSTEVNRRILIIALFCIFLIIFLYNLAVYTSIRDKAYFYYLVVLFFGMITLPTNQVSGYLVSIFGSSYWAPAAARSITGISYTFGAAILTMFMLTFLKVRERHKGWYILFVIFIIIDTLMIPVIHINFEIGINLAAPVTMLLGIFTFVYAGISIHQKFPSATYFFVGHSLLWIGGIINVLETISVIPSNIFTQFSTNFGQVAEMVILSFALANQIIVLRRVNVHNHERLHEEELAREKSEQLLLNILPEATAEELLDKGYATPKNYDMVSILFADIKGYTKISEKVSSDALVSDLNYCFTAFDGIVSRNKLEKIKTIGDAYMCAGGVPAENDTNPVDAVRTALEFQEFVQKWMTEKEAKGMETWQLRVGIHTGPVTTGVLGKTKFAYDMWGDSVNVASRIETHSEPGRVTISSTTYELVKDHFNCTYRGKIDVKNKGKIDMYTVEGFSNP